MAWTLAGQVYKVLLRLSRFLIVKSLRTNQILTATPIQYIYSYISSVSSKRNIVLTECVAIWLIFWLIWLKDRTGKYFQNHVKCWHIWNFYSFAHSLSQQYFLLCLDTQLRRDKARLHTHAAIPGEFPFKCNCRWMQRGWGFCRQIILREWCDIQKPSKLKREKRLNLRH